MLIVSDVLVVIVIYEAVSVDRPECRESRHHQKDTYRQITAFAETVAVNGKLGVVNAVGGSGGGESSAVKSSNAGAVN